MLKKYCDTCKFLQKVIKIDGNDYCVSCNSVINDANSKLKQDTISLSAYQRETVHHILFTTMEWLEKYIEVAGYYPDWESRKQIANNGVVRTDVIGNPKEAEEWFSTTLFGLRQSLENKPKSLHDELKAEFYQWINATGIDANNSAERLKHVLFGFHEVLEGKGEKIMREMMNKKETLDVNAPDYADKLNSFYFSVQTPLDEGRERERLLKNKKSNEINIKSRFGVGDVNDLKQGEESFSKISNEVAGRHDEFHFFPQKEEQQKPWTEGTSTVLTDKVKRNIHEWDIKELIVFDGYSNRKYYGEIKELALVHNSVNLNSYSNRDKGYLKIDPRKVYFKDSLSIEQWNEIERLKGRRQLGNPQQSSNSEIVQDVKNNPWNWRIDEVITEYDDQGRAKKKEIALIHNSAQIGYDGSVLGNNQPVYLAQKFTPEEVRQINEAKGISQGSASSSSYHYQQKPGDNLTNTSNQDNNFGKGGIFAIVAVASALLIASVVVVKKRLSRKVKSR